MPLYFCVCIYACMCVCMYMYVWLPTLTCQRRITHSIWTSMAPNGHIIVARAVFFTLQAFHCAGNSLVGGPIGVIITYKLRSLRRLGVSSPSWGLPATLLSGSRPEHESTLKCILLNVNRRTIGSSVKLDLDISVRRTLASPSFWTRDGIRMVTAEPGRGQVEDLKDASWHRAWSAGFSTWLRSVLTHPQSQGRLEIQQRLSFIGSTGSSQSCPWEFYWCHVVI